MRVVTFDIETANWLGDGEANSPEDLKIAIVCIHDSETDSFDSFLVPDLPRLWPILERTDVLVGWNSDHFDIPLLNKYYPGDLTRVKSLDLMAEIHKVLGRRLKLDAVAEGTLGDKKLDGKGGQSVIWWRAGEVEKVREYCIHDVRLTKNILDYALKNNAVKYRELSTTREVKLDTKGWLADDAGGAMTFSLGF